MEIASLQVIRILRPPAIVSSIFLGEGASIKSVTSETQFETDILFYDRN